MLLSWVASRLSAFRDRLLLRRLLSLNRQRSKQQGAPEQRTDGINSSSDTLTTTNETLLEAERHLATLAKKQHENGGG